MIPFIDEPGFTLYVGDVRDVLPALPAESVDCCVTSPPYWGLRDYGTEGQIGLEATPEEFVARMVEVFREVRRVLRSDGTCWLNLGDSYANPSQPGGGDPTIGTRNVGESRYRPSMAPGLKPKDLIGIPWRVALALQEDGWWLRSDIVWSKPNPMPESVTDRPTKAHEYVFLLAKSARYFFDAEAVLEPYKYDGRSVTHVEGRDGSIQHRNGERWPRRSGNKERKSNPAAALGQGDTKHGIPWEEGEGRNVRTVWEIPTQPFAGAHFATFPEALVRRCVLAGCPAGGVVLDPFMGSGTTAKVARDLGRRAIGVELNPEYAELCDKRNAQRTIFEGAA